MMPEVGIEIEREPGMDFEKIGQIQCETKRMNVNETSCEMGLEMVVVKEEIQSKKCAWVL